MQFYYFKFRVTNLDFYHQEYEFDDSVVLTTHNIIKAKKIVKSWNSIQDAELLEEKEIKWTSELNLIYEIAKFTAENDSLYEGYGYCHDYTKIKFIQEYVEDSYHAYQARIILQIINSKKATKKR